MGNVIASKAYQAKYQGLRSAWATEKVYIEHLDEIADSTFNRMSDIFKPARRTSVVIADGIKLFLKGVKQFSLNEYEVQVEFKTAQVAMFNKKVAEPMQIAAAGLNNPTVELCWGDKINGWYYTTSPSRGKTTHGQGAVDFLTAAVLFGEALRNLLFDEEKNELSLIVLKRFAGFQREYQNYRNGLRQRSSAQKENLRRLILELSDALYMSGAYYFSGDEYQKRNIDTLPIEQKRKSSRKFQETFKPEVLDADFLEHMLAAYTVN